MNLANQPVPGGTSAARRRPRSIRPRLEHLLIVGGIVAIAVGILQPQLSLPSGGHSSLGATEPGVGAVMSASPASPSAGPGPTDQPSLGPSVGPSDSPPASLEPGGTPVPPGATPAPVAVAPAPPTPGSTRRPTPPPTPAPTPTPVGTIHLAGTFADLSAGASARTLSATVKDQFNRPVAGQAVAFSHAGGTGTVTGLGTKVTNSSGVATAELVGARAGPITLKIQAGSVSATVSFTVVAGAFDHVILSPGSAAIAKGGTQVFTTIAYDAAGNEIGNVSSGAVLTITRGGTCTGSSCTATKPGPHTITSVYLGHSDTATLMVHGNGGDAE
jgi:hypothetical protein